MRSILHDLFRLQTLDLGARPANAAESESLRAGIPQGMLANYDRARARGKKGIAVLRNQVCTNCRMQSPIAVTIALKAGLVQACGNCGLYLCLPEPEEEAAAKAPEPAAPKRRKKKAVTAQASPA